MKVKRNVALSDSGFLFNPSTGDSFSINPIGQEIFKMLKDDRSADEIKSHILTTYNTDEVTFEKDFYDFTNMLRRYKLIDDDGEA